MTTSLLRQMGMLRPLWIGSGRAGRHRARGCFRRGLLKGDRPCCYLGWSSTMWMGKLEELLTGRSFDEILAEVRVVATRDGGERLVVAMTESLQRALALLGDEEVGEIADKVGFPRPALRNGR